MDNEIQISLFTHFFSHLVELSCVLCTSPRVPEFLLPRTFNCTIESNGSQTGNLDHRYIIGHLRGGLGNHLWIYSSLYGIAKKTSRVPIACADYDIRRLFVNLTTLIHSTRECRKSSQLNLDKLLSVIEHGNLYYDTSMIGWLKESKESHVLILNYFQNIGYFIEYTSDIKSQFVLGSKYTETAQSYLFSLLSKEMKCNKEIGSGHHEHISSDDKPVFVSVHVRRGDMLMQPYVQVPPASYFHNATQYFNRKYGCFVIFIVITDDLIWSKANIKGENIVFSALWLEYN